MGLQSNNHPNANNSFWFGLAIFLFLMGGVIAAWATHYWPPVWLVVLSIVIDVTMGIVNINNTFETNDNWKTLAGVVAVIATILIYVLPISSHSV